MSTYNVISSSLTELDANSVPLASNITVEADSPEAAEAQVPAGYIVTSIALVAEDPEPAPEDPQPEPSPVVDVNPEPLPIVDVNPEPLPVVDPEPAPVEPDDGHTQNGGV